MNAFSPQSFETGAYGGAVPLPVRAKMRPLFIAAFQSGATTAAEIAGAVGLTPYSTRARLRRYEAEGLVEVFGHKRLKHTSAAMWRLKGQHLAPSVVTSKGLILPPRPGASVSEWAAYRRAIGQSFARAPVAKPQAPEPSRLPRVAEMTPPPREWLFEPPMPLVEYSDPLRYREREPTIRQVVRAVAQDFGVSVADIYSRKRGVKLALPRHVAMFLAKKLTSRDWKCVAIYVAGRDHTTAINSVRAVAKMMIEDEAFEARIARIERAIMECAQ